MTPNPPTTVSAFLAFVDRQPVSLWFLTMWMLAASLWISMGGSLW